MVRRLRVNPLLRAAGIPWTGDLWRRPSAAPSPSSHCGVIPWSGCRWAARRTTWDPCEDDDGIDPAPSSHLPAASFGSRNEHLHEPLPQLLHRRPAVRRVLLMREGEGESARAAAARGRGREHTNGGGMLEEERAWVAMAGG